MAPFQSSVGNGSRTEPCCEVRPAMGTSRQQIVGFHQKWGLLISAKLRILPSKMVMNGDSNIEHRKPTIKIRDKWWFNHHGTIQPSKLVLNGHETIKHGGFTINKKDLFKHWIMDIGYAWEWIPLVSCGSRVWESLARFSKVHDSTHPTKVTTFHDRWFTSPY